MRTGSFGRLHHFVKEPRTLGSKRSERKGEKICEKKEGNSLASLLELRQLLLPNEVRNMGTAGAYQLSNKRTHTHIYIYCAIVQRKNAAFPATCSASLPY